METTVTITPTPKQIADMLFDLSDREVIQVFEEWNKNFEEHYAISKQPGKIDFYGFCLFLTKDMSESAKEVIRSMYSSLIYNTCTKPYYDKTRY